MLTPEQREAHRTGVGSSQVAAIAGLSPFASPMDVWMQLTGLVPEEDDENVQDEREVGSVLEPAVAQIYAKRTGFAVQMHSNLTLRHPEHPWAIASPDATALAQPVEPDRLVEIKVVGSWMTSHWEDGTPEYVICQQAWQIWVTSAARGVRIDRCDLAAVLEGTRYVGDTHWRDDQLIRQLVEMVSAFWHDHVLTKIPPPARAGEERLAYLAKRYPKHRDVILEVPAADAGFVGELVSTWRTAKAVADSAAAAEKAALAPILDLIGDAAGIAGEWGKFTWKSQSGGVAYRAIAQELAGGTIPPALIEKHRSPDYRKPHFSAPRAERKAARKASRKTITHVLGSALAR